MVGDIISESWAASSGISISAREVDPDTGPYGVFKAAIVHYTQGLAQKLAAQRVRANTVSPGTTYFEGGIWHQIKDGDPALYQMALDLNPTGRMGTPQEMANAAVFLASPAASFISGTNLVVVHVSGMVIGRSTITGYDPTVMWIQFLDDASVAEQAQFREGYQILSIDGVTVKSHEDILAALKDREGADVEVIVRNPRFTMISGRFDYFVRTLEVRDVFVVNENGKVR